MDELKKIEGLDVNTLRSRFLSKDRYYFLGVHLWLSLNQNDLNVPNHALNLLLFFKNLMEN